MKEALYYEVHNKEKEQLKCNLCPWYCIISKDKVGNCHIRKNIDNKLIALTYDKFTSISLDPIEKKPLYHYYPGKEILSFGTVGCNFHCQFCQNFEISQADFDENLLKYVTSSEAIRMAKQNKSIGIAYTYNEPLINYEWLKDTAVEARKYGLKNILVSNGYINEEPFSNIVEYIDAANIDVKSFRDDFYKKYCSGKLAPVLRTVEILVKKKKHIEITNLLIPGLNDSDENISDLVDWVSALGEEIPLHFSRYFPCYKLTVKPTPTPTLEKARKIALKKLKHVYIGNIVESEYNRTYCPQCNQIVIERNGYSTQIVGLKDGFCKKCAHKILY
ncbi:MAG TPA: AmmeMemoRadiSam system radical SAM enzyme [Elusimicrobia bacterium]|nr:MAG: AmmeMemoRadiSam system radical SAM enzyme [Elusimicrobia bacterium RIFOXYD2_FULL_34_30]HAM38219.1 AmmeMemoRadiSam system radical SAM enzyme [Elusimicrobiota bacterium]